MLSEMADRRSIRHFEPRSVEPEKLAEILEAGRLAPSAANIQPTRVLVVTRPPDLAVVRTAAYGIGACQSAPCVLICMADLTAKLQMGERMQEMLECGAIEAFDPKSLRSGTGRAFHLKLGPPVSMVGCAVATAHMDLAAVNLGLGTCWVHHADFEELRGHFGIPSHLAILTLLAVGYPAEHPATRPRIASIEWQANGS